MSQAWNRIPICGYGPFAWLPGLSLVGRPDLLILVELLQKFPHLVVNQICVNVPAVPEFFPVGILQGYDIPLEDVLIFHLQVVLPEEMLYALKLIQSHHILLLFRFVVSERDAPMGQVVWRKFHLHAVAGHHADVVLADVP